MSRVKLLNMGPDTDYCGVIIGEDPAGRLQVEVTHNPDCEPVPPYYVTVDPDNTAPCECED